MIDLEKRMQNRSSHIVEEMKKEITGIVESVATRAESAMDKKQNDLWSWWLN